MWLDYAPRDGELDSLRRAFDRYRVGSFARQGKGSIIFEICTSMQFLAHDSTHLSLNNHFIFRLDIFFLFGITSVFLRSRKKIMESYEGRSMFFIHAGLVSSAGGSGFRSSSDCLLYLITLLIMRIVLGPLPYHQVISFAISVEDVKSNPPRQPSITQASGLSTKQAPGSRVLSSRSTKLSTIDAFTGLSGVTQFSRFTVPLWPGPITFPPRRRGSTISTVDPPRLRAF